jgi:serine protease AprX
VARVWHNASVSLSDAEQAPAETSAPGDSLNTVRTAIGANALAAQGITGKGVDVALIDSGVVPTVGLDDSSRIINGPDFSPDKGNPDLQYLDSYGHGTHMAGIIAGNDPAHGFLGIAPDARLVSVKAAGTGGDTNLGALLLAMDWVVKNRTGNGLNVRVLNLSFGSAYNASYVSEPLAYAAEQAWFAGIVVVAAAGNGNDVTGLDIPAADPYVIAVGATDTHGTSDRSDDTVPDWSRVGDNRRSPDVVAPGTSIVSLRDEGSLADTEHPEARVGDYWFKGSGTSQAAAVTSGSVALLLQAHPSWTPDQVKQALTRGAGLLGNLLGKVQGAGEIDLVQANSTPVTTLRQAFAKSSISAILRSLISSAQSAPTAEDPVDLGGSSNLSASRWSASRWSASRWSASRWSASRWSSSRWSTLLWGNPIGL